MRMTECGHSKISYAGSGDWSCDDCGCEFDDHERKDIELDNAASKIKELEGRIELALRLGTFFVGFVPDVLKGRKFSELPQDVQDFLTNPALELTS